MTGSVQPPIWQEAKVYDQWYDTPLGAFVLAREMEVIRHLAHLTGNKRILEVGCGTGQFSRGLTESSATLIGIDGSFPAIAYAAQHIQGSKNISFAVADAHRLPFAHELFDVVVCILTLEFVEKPKAVVNELLRVLKPDGCLIIGILGKWSLWNLKRRLQAALGHPLWSKARFFRPTEIINLLPPACRNLQIESAVFLPPFSHRLLVPFYPLLEHTGKFLIPWGASFVGINCQKYQ